MGYYSDFDICVSSKQFTADEINEIIERQKETNDACANFAYLDYCRGGESWYGNLKWYSCEENMQEISKMFPDAIFIVEVSGEEHGDFWKLYAKNGRTQVCRGEIIYDECDSYFCGDPD